MNIVLLFISVLHLIIVTTVDNTVSMNNKFGTYILCLPSFQWRTFCWRKKGKMEKNWINKLACMLFHLNGSPKLSYNIDMNIFHSMPKCESSKCSKNFKCWNGDISRSNDTKNLMTVNIIEDTSSFTLRFSDFKIFVITEKYVTIMRFFFCLINYRITQYEANWSFNVSIR